MHVNWESDKENDLEPAESEVPKNVMDKGNNYLRPLITQSVCDWPHLYQNFQSK